MSRPKKVNQICRLPLWLFHKNVIMVLRLSNLLRYVYLPEIHQHQHSHTSPLPCSTVSQILFGAVPRPLEEGQSQATTSTASTVTAGFNGDEAKTDDSGAEYATEKWQVWFAFTSPLYAERRGGRWRTLTLGNHLAGVSVQKIGNKCTYISYV